MPIGAGLQNLPQKKRRRPRRYREGGSFAPFLMVALMGSTGYYAYAKQPWNDGFEDVRVHVLGETPSLKIEGAWEVTKLLAPAQRTGDAPTRPATSGMLAFKDGAAKIRLTYDGKPWTASARYTLKESRLTLAGLKATPDRGGKGTVRCSVSDLGEGNVLASFEGGGALYLHRIEGSEKVAKTVAYRLAGDMVQRIGEAGE